MSISSQLADLRRSYQYARLQRQDLHADPFEQFSRWFMQAQQAQLPEPNAMTLATADSSGRPSARIVLLKGLEQQHFLFYSNYRSRKGQELAHNPQAALVFNWLELERQVRIEGRVQRLGREESLAYFRSRPYASQLGAWASQQSEVIADDEDLAGRLEALRQRYPQGEVPLPDFWGGYALEADVLEFWQGRPSRLHDRFRYTRNADSWQLVRLSP